MSGELTFEALVGAIQVANQHLTRQARVAVNVSLSLRNWLIGHYIDAYQLEGSDRARYGEELLARLADSLQKLGVPAVGHRQLYGYLGFFRSYPEILRTPSAKSSKQLTEAIPEILRTLSAKSSKPEQSLLLNLSYSHFELLVRLDSPEKRRFYQEHCLQAGWSVRELKRQIATLYYERTALSDGNYPMLSLRLKSQVTNAVYLLRREMAKEPLACGHRASSYAERMLVSIVATPVRGPEIHLPTNNSDSFRLGVFLREA